MEILKPIIAYACILLFVVGLIYVSVGWIMLQVNPGYTIGWTDGEKMTFSRSGAASEIYLRFSIHGKKYFGSDKPHSTTKKEGGFYLVKFVRSWPSVNDVNFRYGVDDTTGIQIPPNGWDEPPAFLTDQWKKGK